MLKDGMPTDKILEIEERLRTGPNTWAEARDALIELMDLKIAAAFGEFIEPDGHVPVPKSDVFRKLARHPGKQRS